MASSGDITVIDNSSVTAITDSVTGTAGMDITVDVTSSITGGVDVTLTAGDNVLVDNNSTVQAVSNDLLIRAGDDVTIAETGTLLAGNRITIEGDFGNDDPGVGTFIQLHGTIQAQRVDIFGEADDDEILLSPFSLIGHTQVFGRGGEDLITADQLPTIDSLHNRSLQPDAPTGTPDRDVLDTVDIDGGAATDHVVVNTTGGRTSYLMNVKDSGAPDDGADRLTINGTDANDLFLLRKHFVAYLTPINPLVIDSPVGDLHPEVERINYDQSTNGRLRVNSGLGDDQMYIDDNSAITTLDGGQGKDLFQVGQIFGTNPNGSDDDPRVVADDVDQIDLTADNDEIELNRITRGFLSNGVTFPTVIFGGEGGDLFTVYSNKALLRMEGEDGNDTFVIRAFIAEDDVVAEGGGDDDHFEYNINAPVSINGGAGFDTVVVIGDRRGRRLHHQQGRHLRRRPHRPRRRRRRGHRGRRPRRRRPLLHPQHPRRRRDDRHRRARQRHLRRRGRRYRGHHQRRPRWRQRRDQPRRQEPRRRRLRQPPRRGHPP